MSAPPEITPARALFLALVLLSLGYIAYRIGYGLTMVLVGAR